VSPGATALTALGLLPFLLGLAWLAARDMASRGRTGDVYAVLVIFLPPLGLLAWALDRRRCPVLTPAEREARLAEGGGRASYF
jgi:hypothetical protein